MCIVNTFQFKVMWDVKQLSSDHPTANNFFFSFVNLSWYYQQLQFQKVKCAMINNKKFVHTTADRSRLLFKKVHKK